MSQHVVGARYPTKIMQLMNNAGNNSNMAIKYALFPNNLTSDPDDYMAVVQDQTSKSMENIIDEMIGRGSTVTKAEALSVIEEYEAAVQKALEDGNSISTPLFKISASVSGVFDSGEDGFDRARHYVNLNVNPGDRIDDIAAGIAVEKVEASRPMPDLRNFKDVASDTINDTLTPGLVGELTGSRLKIDPADDQQGVFFIAADGTETKSTVLVRNKPSNLIFMIPGGLAADKYSLEVRVKIGKSKELRTGRLDNKLTVV